VEHKQITQSDIARLAGVTRPTVTLALKGASNVSDSTRTRILKIAREIGYVRDPVLSALAAYRSPAIKSKNTLVWLVNGWARSSWNNIPTYRDYFLGACQGARHYGFKLQICDLSHYSSTLMAAAELQRKKIGGILLCPQPHTIEEMIFPWQEFSVVTLGYTLLTPQLHAVSTAHFRNMSLVVRRMQEYGYKRIGFALPRLHDSRVDKSYSAAYYAIQTVAELPTLPLLPVEDYGYPIELLKNWILENEIDGILTAEKNALRILRRLGLDAPSQLGVACPFLTQRNSEVSGVYEDSRYIGETAAKFLVALLQRGERGIPATPHRVHVQGKWVAGISLKQQPEY
jgi:LacI family transcriptional regulator/LacI family repressor for deo operon, udp, cdd, tsx, nupC, and nupG